MGVMYGFGLGVEQDFNAAMQWYLDAAAAGDAIAENNLGVMYQRGMGAAVDYQEAVKWYKRSVDHGHLRAIAAAI